MGVTYHEVEGWPEELLDDNITGLRGSFDPVRKLRCAWEDRLDLVEELFYTYYPYSTPTSAIATKFTCKPFPKSRTDSSEDPLIGYDEALVTVYYTSDRFMSGKDYFIEQLIPEPGYDARYSHNGLFWGSSAGTALEQGEGPVISYSGLKYILTYFQLPEIPVAWVAFKDTVNGGQFITKALGLTFDTDCIKYEGVQLSHRLSHRGVVYYTAQLTFDYKYAGGLGWQGLWNPNYGTNGGWQAIYNSIGQVLLYPRSIFTF